MSFPFRCPHCGAESEADESQIGQTGNCHACGRPVTVLPPVTQMTPPSAGISALAGAIVGAAMFLLTIGIGYTLPVLRDVQQLRGGISSDDLAGELGSLFIWTLVGGGLGAGFLAAAAAVSSTRAVFGTLRRGALIGLVIGGIGGAVAAAVRSAMGLAVLHDELSSCILLGGFLGALFGALIAYLLANARERALLQSIVFEAGPPSQPDQKETPVMAAVVDEEWSDQELTAQRRQALIRRLAQSRQSAGDGGEE